MDSLFEALDFGNGVYHIRMPGKTPGPGRVFSSLIIGDEKAMVIDNGYGIGDYLGYVRTLTDKPLIAVNTHGHLDHAGGNGQFKEVWLNQADWELAKFQSSRQVRESSDGSRDYKDMLIDGDWMPLPLEAGTTFDLGGRTVTAYPCVGHTRGCMSFLDSRTRWLFTGDNITRRVLLLFGVSLGEFYQTLLDTAMLDFDSIVAAHVPYRMPKSWIDKVRGVVESFDPAKGKDPICFNIRFPGLEPKEFTVGRDFDDPEYCGFVFNAAQLDEFLAGGLPKK